MNQFNEFENLSDKQGSWNLFYLTVETYMKYKTYVKIGLNLISILKWNNRKFEKIDLPNFLTGKKTLTNIKFSILFVYKKIFPFLFI